MQEKRITATIAGATGRGSRRHGSLDLLISCLLSFYSSPFLSSFPCPSQTARSHPRELAREKEAVDTAIAAAFQDCFQSSGERKGAEAVNGGGGQRLADVRNLVDDVFNEFVPAYGREGVVYDWPLMHVGFASLADPPRVSSPVHEPPPEPTNLRDPISPRCVRSPVSSGAQSGMRRASVRAHWSIGLRPIGLRHGSVWPRREC